MQERIYTVNEIFVSLQGEGVRAGTFNIFVRFTGCNLKCSLEKSELSPGGFDCDTEFASGRQMTANEIINACTDEIKHVVGRVPAGIGVIFTGGEPALQVDAQLVSSFHSSGFFPVCIETNGSKDVSALDIDWITVSPKVAEHAIRQRTANEVKYVRGYGQAIPSPAVEADNYLISPAFDGIDLSERNLQWCIKLVKENPGWRLSVQLHKGWKVR